MCASKRHRKNKLQQQVTRRWSPPATMRWGARHPAHRTAPAPRHNERNRNAVQKSMQRPHLPPSAVPIWSPSACQHHTCDGQSVSHITCICLHESRGAFSQHTLSLLPCTFLGGESLSEQQRRPLALVSGQRQPIPAGVCRHHTKLKTLRARAHTQATK